MKLSDLIQFKQITESAHDDAFMAACKIVDRNADADMDYDDIVALLVGNDVDEKLAKDVALNYRRAPHVTEGKMRKETASDAFYRYDKLKKSFKNPTPDQQKLLDNVLALANSLMDEQFKKTQSNLEAKFAGSDWWEEVKKMYEVKEEGNKWVVVSNARDWKQTKDWEYDTKYEALEQLEKLIKYKAADRKAGKGSVDKDFERIDALRAKQEA